IASIEPQQQIHTTQIYIHIHQSIYKHQKPHKYIPPMTNNTYSYLQIIFLPRKLYSKLIRRASTNPI
ncbi:hypothetical protein Leryth_003241, partial [Lithospermum erythrorhizon]